MDNEIQDAIKALRGLLEKNAPSDTSSVRLFFNCQGHVLEYETRSPESLNEDGISMRNIRGEWIK